MGLLNGEIKKKSGPKRKIKSSHPPRQYTVSKFYELFELLLYTPYSSDLVLKDYFLFENLKIKNMVLEKRFISNDDAIAETNAYFEEEND